MFRRNSGPFFLTELLQPMFLGCLVCMAPCHSITSLLGWGWALTGSLQKADFLGLKSLCSRSTFMLRITFLLHHLAFTEPQLVDSCPDIILWETMINLMMACCAIPKAEKQSQIMMLHPVYFTFRMRVSCWYSVHFLHHMWCCVFFLNNSTLVSSVHKPKCLICAFGASFLVSCHARHAPFSYAPWFVYGRLMNRDGSQRQWFI